MKKNLDPKSVDHIRWALDEAKRERARFLAFNDETIRNLSGDLGERAGANLVEIVTKARDAIRAIPENTQIAGDAWEGLEDAEEQLVELLGYIAAGAGPHLVVGGTCDEASGRVGPRCLHAKGHSGVHSNGRTTWSTRKSRSAS